MAIQDVIFVCVSAPLAHLVELAYASRPLDASSARRHGSALSLTRLVVSPLPYCTCLELPVCLLHLWCHSAGLFLCSLGRRESSLKPPSRVL